MIYSFLPVMKCKMSYRDKKTFFLHSFKVVFFCFDIGHFKEISTL